MLQEEGLNSKPLPKMERERISASLDMSVKQIF